jgi:large subunit ribosomal protein L17
MANRKLGRTSGHRLALFRNQVASMIQHERIVTTLPKAKELRPIIEKMVTLGKTDSVHNRRQAAQTVLENTLVQKLFTQISPRFAERPGGYTRIVKMGPRRGDGAEMAILEFVDYSGKVAPTETSAPAPKARKAPASKQSTADASEAGAKKRTAKAADKGAAEEKPKKPRKKKEDEA